jgi:nucleoside-diphosphate-sugar epimerase
VARVLIVGCGCRGRELTRELVAAGHAVRGTTRDEASLAAIRDAGAEAVVADPDRVGTIAHQLHGVAVLVHLLAGAQGPGAAELHGHRLRALLEKIVDSPVRGFVYEPAHGGRAIVEEAAETWAIPVAFATPGTPALGLVESLVAG